MQKKCKKYAKNMQKICKNICIACTTNIYRGPIQYAALVNMQKIAKKMQKKCKKNAKNAVCANYGTNMQNMHPGVGPGHS